MRPLRLLGTLLACSSLATALVAAHAQPAAACGGFFCSFLPIDQTGEQIVFSVEPGKVTATIQIAYQGEAQDFAWVVPVPGQPDIRVGAQGFFGVVEQATAPQWYLQWQNTGGQCGFFSPEEDFAAGPPNAGGGDDEVVVLAEEQVGPFETVTLAAKDATKLIEWLDGHGFFQPDGSVEIMDHYIDQGLNFVAMKLGQDEGTGDIQPIVLEMDSDEPCVPLVLTRIAAQPDMPVKVWVFGAARAVPTNWYNVVVNEKKIDWLNYGANYGEVATQAVNDAAGHGFITEFAGKHQLGQQLWAPGRFQTAALAALSDPAQFLDAMLGQGFPRDAQIQALIRKHMPMPPADALPDDCKDEAAFYNWNKEMCLLLLAPGAFDATAFAADLETRVVEPLRDAQEQVDAHEYLTRLYTTVSADEMTRDPMFALNADLPDVSNLHQASASGTCDDSGTIKDITITLSSGETIFIAGPIQQWGGDYVFADPAPAEAAAARIERLAPTGPPTLVALADVTATEAAIEAADTTFLALDGTKNPVVTPPPTQLPSAQGVSGGTGCHSGDGPHDHGALPAALTLAALFGVAVVRRRRTTR
jgi:MYXO-CTERM domain-containing protein